METGKVYIEYQFKEGPYGGANQFLKCLRDYLVRMNLYSETPENAKYILINHTNIRPELLKLKKENPEKIMIHRVDGPVSKHRKRSKILDKQSFFLDKILCEGTVFQSKWTMESCMEEGYKKTGLTTIIHNAPDPAIFGMKDSRKRGKAEGKCRLIATSWSSNWNKGFDVLQYMDEHLDFEKYEFTFVGNSPIEFKNIKQLPAMSSRDLASVLQEHDIYIAVSRSESCSNSLLEAINCGLVVAARDSGCYREVIKEGGVIANDAEKLCLKLDVLRDNIEKYQEKLPYYDIEEIGGNYYRFMEEVGREIESGKQKCKFPTMWNVLGWKSFVLFVKVKDKVNRVLRLT